MSFFLCLFQEFVQRINGADFYMHGRASAYFFVVILEYIFHMLGLNEQVDRVVIVCNDFTGISFGNHVFELSVSQFSIYTCIVVAGKIEICNGHCYEHI